MKEIKNKKIEFRLTEKEKELIQQYADKRDMTMSEVIRELCEKIFVKGQEE